MAGLHLDAYMVLMFHGLLTQPDSHAEGSSERSCAEKELVRIYLQSLPSALRAQESYALMTDYALATRAQPAQARWDQSVLEKFLLWSFIVKTKPLAELNNSDVQDFLSFCNTPPESWISKSNDRFVKEFGLLKANPEWRPFHSPLCEHGVRWVINRFFSFNSEAIGLVICPASRPETPHVNTCSCTDAEPLCCEYLDALKEITNGKKGLELGLFMFATSFYLKVPLRDCLNYLTFDCFDFSDKTNGRFKVNTGNGSISGRVPEHYMEYFLRWRQISQLLPYPTPDEMQPLFHRRAKNYPTDYLPKIDVNGLLPTKLLRAFNEGCARCRKPEGQLLSSFDRSKKYRNKVANKQEAFSTIERLHQESNNINHDTSATAVPLYLVKEGVTAQLPEKVITHFLTSFNPASSKEICSAGASLFCLFVRGEPNYLNLRAFEKLTLWSILVAGKSPADLDASDAKSFYQFCLNPPAQWISTRIYSRSSILWRPFLKLRPGKANNVPRAGMIVRWCNACYIQLVQAGILRSNPFQRLNKYIN